MQSGQDSSVVKPRRRRLSTAHARRRARVYSNSFRRELLEEHLSADELRGSRESSLGNGSAAFLKGLLCETDGSVKGISERYETQREVSELVDYTVYEQRHAQQSALFGASRNYY